MRRTFELQSVDINYIDNKIAQAINELKEMKDEEGTPLHTTHNFTKVVTHLDKVHGLKINIVRNLKEKDLEALASKTYKIFRTLYRNKAIKYESAKGNNYTFNSRSNSKLLLKAVKNRSNIK